MSGFSDAFDQVHPDFVDLLFRLDLLPTDEGTGFSEANLARTIFLAIELADPYEQALLVSRIITDEEMAAERLRDREVQDTTHRVVLGRAERRVALREDPSEPTPGRGNGKECLICSEDAHVQAPCGCNYCLYCYREAIRVGLRSQEEFPPKCCQPFSEEAIRLARSPALIHLFRQMQEEADAPIIDRLYCFDPNCAAFIPPHRNGDCLLCDSHTCTDCGGQAHQGRRCERGDAEEDVWATMDANRSVNCPGCARMITLAEACNHMTCPCGQEFCFICGEAWKTCNCPNYGGFERMVRMERRPGLKPQRYRRRVRHTEETAANATDPLKIPQLRPMPGEEERVPVSSGTRQRVIRPLRLPGPERRPQERQPREHGEGERREGHRHHHRHGHRHGHHRERNHGVLQAPPIFGPAQDPVRFQPHDVAEVRRGVPYDPRPVQPRMPEIPVVPGVPAMDRVRDNGPPDMLHTDMEQVRRGAISRQGGQRAQGGQGAQRPQRRIVGIEDFILDNGFNVYGGQYDMNGAVNTMAQIQIRGQQPQAPAVMPNRVASHTPLGTYYPSLRNADSALVVRFMADEHDGLQIFVNGRPYPHCHGH
ncbi:hypothetical protein F53441_2602 [Fusarium austroafricanum]|uniref:RBR-type E3 ubiquitin transferase n=1 Tax=Fusarium austroafricanum TaxID=2364996 RepID=A0A8H4KP90_9HYPO|nr:hypothetical protein F53441_2602 [Fusarium austroafricanum]